MQFLFQSIILYNIKLFPVVIIHVRGVSRFFVVAGVGAILFSLQAKRERDRETEKTGKGPQFPSNSKQPDSNV